MGGAPSRETLVRHIVREPRAQEGAAPIAGRSGSGGSGSAGEPLADEPTATPQQPEIILIPLITDYFPSSSSPLFQQLLHVRREPNVAYYYRDSRSTSTEHTVVRDYIGSDEDMYNWYMSLSEQRVLETDNELIALSRAGRVVSPVPCAVAFVYETSATVAVTAAASATGIPSSSNSVGRGKKKSGANGRAHRQGKAGGSSTSNGYMTVDNTVRLPHCHVRVRIFGFVGDTRFCPPSLHPSQAAKLPMCFTVFLSKSAGGNHRVQVTLLAAHMYVTQMQALGILRPYDEAPRVGGGVAQSAMTCVGFKASMAGSEADPLAALRLAGAGGAADAYGDPYADAYGDDGGEGGRHLPLPTTNSVPRDGAKARLGGLEAKTTSASVDIFKEAVLRRPIEVVMHRADVPALCYMRELRARMSQSSARANAAVCEKQDQPPLSSACGSPMASSYIVTASEGSCSGNIRAASLHGSACSQQSSSLNKWRLANAQDCQVSINTSAAHADCVAADAGAESLKCYIRTVIGVDELRGSVAADAIGRVLLWASCFYTAHFEQLIGGEAARLRQELAQRNLTESPLHGALFLTDEEPRPPKVVPKAGDVWIPSNEAYVEVRGTADGGEGWAKLAAGTVLRYVTSAPSASTTSPPEAFWRVSPNEFAEDILLSLCRQACQASRRASPTDPHWLLNRKTGLPEGLAVGLLIWRELCAGQTVFYGTTPEFLKKWMQSGAEVEQAFRDHVERPHASKEAATAAAAAECGNAIAEREAEAAEVGQSSSAIGTATTATFNGLQSSHDGHFPLNPSGASSGPVKSDSSGGGRGKGSNSSSMALYSAHTGFVSTSEQAAPVSSPAPSKENGNHGGEGAKPTRACADNDPSAPSSPTPSVTVGSPANPRGVFGTPDERTPLGRSLSAHQRLEFTIPGAPSAPMTVRAPSSSALGTPNSYMKMNLTAGSMTSRSSSASLTFHQLSQHVSPAAAAATCWMGVPGVTLADSADAPTVNVVVRQRRSARATPGNAAAVGTTPLHASHMHNSPHERALRGAPSVLPVSTKPIAVGAAAGASVECHAQAPGAATSLPVLIPVTWDSSSGDESLRQGGHSPASVEQSRSLLRAGGELLSHSCSPNSAAALGDARRPPPQGSAAVKSQTGRGTGNMMSTPLQAAAPVRWSTASAVQPSSMRGASVAFASGSASSTHARHASLLHSVRHTELCQPVASRSSSLLTSEPLMPSVYSSGSHIRQKESASPLSPLNTAGDGACSSYTLLQTPLHPSGRESVHRGRGKVAPAETPAAVPVVAPRPGGEAMTMPRSGHRSAAHTPLQGDLANSAKSSVGSGKYRWDWRGVSWAA
ncbi:hypothetical protein LSCM1_03191 [Leishmania martiniquensis]|uniref:Uncharacterized protein n=1 Tax=Leishmania martiniquensis TaxID=1580590 RepID=A0A836KFL1_9TRYP|nr:hypothetical protein LSCM1_03191 [Leishmania martiniquensis]